MDSVWTKCQTTPKYPDGESKVFRCPRKFGKFGGDRHSAVIPLFTGDVHEALLLFFFTKCFVSTIYIISAANKKRKVEIAIYLENSSHSSGAYSTRNDTRECLSSVYYPCATALLFRENVKRKCSRASLLQRNILLKLSLMSLLKNA